MFEIILSGWFIISAHTTDIRHDYTLTDPIKNVIVIASLDEPLTYEAGTWIKLRMQVECTKTSSYPVQSFVALVTTRCVAKSVRELKCTERNSMVVGGIRYC